MRCTLEDKEVVQRILSDKSVFFTAKDDGVNDAENLAETSLADEKNFILMPSENTLFFYKAINHIMYEVHVAITKSSARLHGVESAKKAARWMFENTPCTKLVAYIPEYHAPSIMFAQVCGMKMAAVLNDAFMNNGNLYNLVILEATREELYNLHGRV